MFSENSNTIFDSLKRINHMKLSGIFSTGRSRLFSESVEKLLNTVDTALILFKEGVRCYLYNNTEDFSLTLSSMATAETEAGVLRRDIENMLYSRGSLIRYRGDIMRLLERFDHIITIVSNDLIQFEIESPNVPDSLKKEFVKLAELATLAAETTIPAARAYFNRPDQVTDSIHRVYLYEKQAVKLSQSIKRTVFHEMDQLKLSEKFHLRYFALHIEDLSTAAVKVAEQLSVMTIKRSL